MNKKTIYIAGPMAGLPNNNFPAFAAAEEWLEAQGWEPINPAKFNAALGLGLGIFTLPIILVAWPFVAAWWMWNESYDNYNEGEKE